MNGLINRVPPVVPAPAPERAIFAFNALSFAGTGVLNPFFGTLFGWLGGALTGSDTSSNVLFGSLQTTSAGRIGLSPILMAAANSSGEVIGKMIDAQRIVASTATKVRSSATSSSTAWPWLRSSACW